MTERIKQRWAQANAAAEKFDAPLFRLIARGAMIIGALIGAPALAIMAMGWDAKINTLVSETPAFKGLATDTAQNAAGLSQVAEKLQTQAEQVRDLQRLTAEHRLQFDRVMTEITRCQGEIASMQRYQAAFDEWKNGTDRRLQSVEGNLQQIYDGRFWRESPPTTNRR